MIVPSIDLMGGQTVQLIGGKEHALDAGDPRPIAARFAIAGEIAVVDLDGALGRGSNSELIHELVRPAVLPAPRPSTSRGSSPRVQRPDRVRHW